MIGQAFSLMWFGVSHVFRRKEVEVNGEGKAGFLHRLRHSYPLQSFATCETELTVDVAIFGVLAAIS